MDRTALAIKRKNRWIPVIAGVFIQICLGSGYIWSVFQSYLIIGKTTPDALFNWPATYGTITYALLMLTISVGSIIGGKLLGKYNHPRPVIIIGGLAIGLGGFLALFTTESTPWLLWLTYGLIQGTGVGVVYSTNIATCQKWFPDKRGMVTGIVVAALGFGGLIITYFAEMLIRLYSVMKTFAIFAVIFTIVITICAQFIKNPPAGYQPDSWTPLPASGSLNTHQFKPSEVLKTRQFYMVAIAFMCAGSAGAMMIPMAKILGLQPASGLTGEEDVAGVMIIALCNSFGRLFWGWVSDRIGRKATIMTLMAIAGISIVGVSFTSGYLMLAVIAAIGFSYGGFHGVFPALTADFWGGKYVSINYGLVLIGFGIGASASAYLVAYLSRTQAFSTSFVIAGIAAAVGILIMSFLKIPKQPLQAK